MNNNKQSKVILYLGAGASYFAGYHTFVNFPDLLFNPDLRKSEGMPNLDPNSERILQAIRKSLVENNKATTHDNFLWRLDGYNQFLRLNQSDPVLQDYLRGNNRLYDLFICTEQAISQISTSTVHHYSSKRVEMAKAVNGPVFENMHRVLSLYHDIAKLNGINAALPVFTTNYDMLLEDLINEFAGQNKIPITLVNGIHGLTKELMPWDSQEYACSSSLCTLHLHRLHGCVCWFYHDPGDSNIYFHRYDATQQQIDKLYAMYPGREARIGIGPHGNSFRTFYQQLQVCNLVIFIGFSFRDDDVMHVLLKALAERRGKLKILVVDLVYNKDDVRNKLSDASHRTSFPFRIPKAGEIESLKMRFGSDPGFDTQILDLCRSLIN
jgi:hypothetical protein